MTRPQSRLRAELIQVAAVAVAIVHDLDYGETGAAASSFTAKDIERGLASEVIWERERQEKKWGSQHHDPTVWMSILMEEVGEAAQEALRMTNEAVREMDAQKESSS